MFGDARLPLELIFRTLDDRRAARSTCRAARCEINRLHTGVARILGGEHVPVVCAAFPNVRTVIAEVAGKFDEIDAVAWLSSVKSEDSAVTSVTFKNRRTGRRLRYELRSTPHAKPEWHCVTDCGPITFFKR